MPIKITRFDTFIGPILTTKVRHSRRGQVRTTGRLYEEHQSQETATRGGCCLDRFVGLSRFAAGGGAALPGGVAVSAIERALDWPAHFGHTWLGFGIWPHGHSS